MCGTGASKETCKSCKVLYYTNAGLKIVGSLCEIECSDIICGAQPKSRLSCVAFLPSCSRLSTQRVARNESKADALKVKFFGVLL